MDFIKLEELNQKAYGTSNIDLLLDEYLEVFQNTVTNIKSRDKFDSEKEYLEKILFDTRIQRNKYTNYREFTAVLVARLAMITEDYIRISYLIKKNINEENIELFYFFAKNKKLAAKDIDSFIDEFYENVRFETRSKLILESVYEGRKAYSEEKNIYYGSCKSSNPSIINLATSFRLNPHGLVEEVKRKIESRDIMDLHKLVYKYLEVTGNFDTELLYIVFRFLLKNKITRPVLEMLDLYTMRFKMRVPLDINLLLYVCSYCKGSKKITKHKLYLKTLDIYTKKRPADIAVGLIYISTVIENYKYGAKEIFTRYLRSIQSEEAAYAFLDNVSGKLPEEWQLKNNELHTIVENAAKSRTFTKKHVAICLDTLPKLTREGIEERLRSYYKDKRINFANFVFEISLLLRKRESLEYLKCLLKVLEVIMKYRECVSEMYIYKTMYTELLYILDIDKKRALEELEVMSLYELTALTALSKINFEKHLEEEEYEKCYLDLLNITDPQNLQKCAYKLDKVSNIDLSDMYKFIKRVSSSRANLEKAPTFIQEVEDETLESLIEVKDKLKAKVESKKNEIAFSRIYKGFSIDSISKESENHIKKHSRIDFQKKAHTVFLVEPFEAIQNALEDLENHEYVLCSSKIVITVPYDKVGYIMKTKGKVKYCDKMTLVFSIFDKSLISAYPV